MLCRAVQEDDTMGFYHSILVLRLIGANASISINIETGLENRLVDARRGARLAEEDTEVSTVYHF